MNITFFKFIITKKISYISYISYISFFSESVKLELEDVSDSEITNDQLNDKELDNNEKGVANIASFRSLNIYFLPPLLKLLSSAGFLRAFKMFSLPVIHFPSLSLHGMDSESLLLRATSLSINNFKEGWREVQIEQFDYYI